MNKTCPHCRAPLLESQRFCRYCGYRLDEGIQEYVETRTFGQTRSKVSQLVESASETQSWPALKVGGTKPLIKRGRRMSLLYGIMALVLLCALGLGISSYVGSGQGGMSVFSGRQVAGPPSYLGVYFAEGESGGAFIDSVATSGGPADLAGFIGGDLIVEADGRPIHNVRDMRRVLALTPPGSKIDIEFLRDGRRMETVLVTAARGDFAFGRSKAPYGFFGVDTGKLERVHVTGSHMWGVRLGRVLPNNPADTAGIQEGDIVIEFDHHPIRTPRELLRRIQQSKPYSLVDVEINRHGKLLTIPVKMGRNNG